MEYFVKTTGSDFNDGTESSPFKTISKAAALAQAGDTVTVFGGTYREWVRPQNGGRNDNERIVYRAAKGERPVIKGSEEVSGWKNEGGSLWSVTVPNTIWAKGGGNGVNPFAKPVWGDWVVWPLEKPVHLGDVYINGKSLYEAMSLEEVRSPKKRTTGYNPPWTKHEEPILEPEKTVYQWFAQVENEETKIYANFQELDPNKELVEISVRQSCFYPDKTGLDYITLDGFEICQAASPWAPPTADQPGMIGPHWAKGWIIQNCVVHDAKCSAISLGKEASTGDNDCTKFREKPGYQFQMEAVFKALQAGWSKEKIGGHIVRDNEIYDCGQNGIVGHMGCAFSVIERNHIYNIAVKHEYFGYEIGGIKFHAAIDTIIRNNNIHNCTLGTWLDWETQGTRISSNLYYANDRDLMVEVSHGPYIVDNNIFASAYNFDNISQGGAYVHNLCLGTMRREQVMDRATPYHYPHSTAPLGTALIFSGDDRVTKNIYVGGAETWTEQSKSGTDSYNQNLFLTSMGSWLFDFAGAPREDNKEKYDAAFKAIKALFETTEFTKAASAASFSDYKASVKKSGDGDHDVFMRVQQAVYIKENHYCGGAARFAEEKAFTESDKNPNAKIVVEGKKTFLEFTADQNLLSAGAALVSTKDFAATRISAARFDGADGNDIVFDKDILGESRVHGKAIPGPFAQLKAGANKILVWDSGKEK